MALICTVHNNTVSPLVFKLSNGQQIYVGSSESQTFTITKNDAKNINNALKMFVLSGLVTVETKEVEDSVTTDAETQDDANAQSGSGTTVQQNRIIRRRKSTEPTSEQNPPDASATPTAPTLTDVIVESLD